VSFATARDGWRQHHRTHNSTLLLSKSRARARSNPLKRRVFDGALAFFTALCPSRAHEKQARSTARAGIAAARRRA
jgi:hypothetical protein